MELCIHRTMPPASKQAKHLTIKHVQESSLEQEHLHVHEFTLRRWMHELTYSWDDKDFIGALSPDARDIRTRAFIWSYAAALRLQSAGTHVVIYQDESYIHTTHQMKKGWHPTQGPLRNNATAGNADTGKRLIIIHAMSNERMLDADDAVGSNMLHESTLTAQFFFEAASFDDSDYHNTFDGESFTLWVKNRLIPAFQPLYPGKKMLLVMDNAPYHLPRDVDWRTPHKMGKVECITFLQHHNVLSFSSTRDGVTVHFPAATWSQRSRHSAITIPELRAQVKSVLQQNPAINQTKINKLFCPLDWSMFGRLPSSQKFSPLSCCGAR